jgi:hypothetical protein
VLLTANNTKPAVIEAVERDNLFIGTLLSKKSLFAHAVACTLI